jgi:hypothetical protein
MPADTAVIGFRGRMLVSNTGLGNLVSHRSNGAEPGRKRLVEKPADRRASGQRRHRADR